jgi:hypothetical protein
MDLKSREPRAVPMNRPADTNPRIPWSGHPRQSRDRCNQAIDPNQGIRVRSEHIHMALREFANIVNHPFCQRFPLQVPADEKLHGFWS